MKKIFLLIIIAITFASCHKEKDDVAQPKEEQKEETKVEIPVFKPIINENLGTTLIPEKLKEGDKVGIFSIANHVEESEIKAAIDTLKKWGLQVVLADNLFDQNGRYDGTQEESILATQKLIDNQEIKALISVRGGYGSARIVPYLDFSNLAKFPKWIVGYSDITAFHIALNNLGYASILGPMMNNFSNKQSTAALKNALMQEPKEITIAYDPNNQLGKSEGRLIGGNLSLIHSLMGTPYQLDTKGGILFIEETGEANYRIDRMLRNLMLAGCLDNINGIIVGQIVGGSNNGGQDPDVATIIKNLVGNRKYPIIFGMQNGHSQPNLSLMLGQKISIEATPEESKITYIEDLIL